MNAHDDSRFAAYVLGLLPSVEQGEVAAHVSACPRCAAALQGVAEALHALALTLPPQPPPADGLAHVLAAARADAAGPFGAFVTRVAHLFDVGVERAREMLAGLGDPVGWVTGGEGIWLLHLQGGPRTVGADAGLVRMAPGARFPRHRHTGTEFAVILQG